MKLHNHQKLAIRALENMKGDNTARMLISFKNYTPEQMNEQYGQSGKTCAEILSNYEQHDEKINNAIEWVRTAR